MTSADTLILGWGNPGRADDGLGPELVRRLAEQGLPGIETESDYQLQVEHGEQIRRYRRVVFVDADRTGPAPFWLDRLRPVHGAWAFSTHSISPRAVLSLACDLYQAEPEAWLLGVRGYEFDEFREGLSRRARANLEEALGFLQTALAGVGLRPVRPWAVPSPTLNDTQGEPCLTTNP